MFSYAEAGGERDFKSSLIRYFKENLGAPFVMAFMALLITAAVFLAVGDEDFANTLAVYAYYNLVIGVVLQLVALVRSERGRSQNS
ncbi:MAG: hypothetical protein ACTSXX_05315 [Candidatus Baldrarchaeia archaeon]